MCVLFVPFGCFFLLNCKFACVICRDLNWDQTLTVCIIGAVLSDAICKCRRASIFWRWKNRNRRLRVAIYCGFHALIAIIVDSFEEKIFRFFFLVKTRKDLANVPKVYFWLLRDVIFGRKSGLSNDVSMSLERIVTCSSTLSQCGILFHRRSSTSSRENLIVIASWGKS